MASTHRDEISRLELLHAAHPDGLVFPHLADAYRRDGRYSQAESILVAGLRHHADYPSAYLVMGRLRLDQGRPEQALSAFRRVLQLDPQNQVALQHLGDMAANDGRLDDALAYFRKLRRLNPDAGVDARIAELEAAKKTAHPALAPPGRGGTGAVSGTAGSAGRRPVAGPVEAVRRSGNGGGSVAPSRMPEPGEVVTETMAELYARQGLYDRAAAVYRQLLQNAPADDRLRAKLEQVESRPGGAATSGARTPGDTLSSAPVRPEPSGAPPAAGSIPPRRSKPGEPSAPPSGAGEGTVRPGSSGRWARETPVHRSAPARSAQDGGIGRHLRTLLRWTPPPPAPEPARSGPAPEEWGSGPWHDETLPGQALDAGEGGASVRGGEPRPAAPSPEAAGAGRADPLQGLERVGGGGVPTRTLLALSDLLVGLLEYRDPFFRGSSSLTRLLATGVAEEMGLGEAEKADLALAAVLRDLGRLALGGRLLPVPRLHPTGENRRKIERHVDLALRLLEGIDLPPAVRLAVRHHHERWDGVGYPDALSGETIPILARILAVVDSFTAMVSPRPYRLPRRVPDAARELEEETGTRYDPSVVAALLRVLGRRAQPHLGFVQRQHVLLVNPDQVGAVVTAAKLCSAGYLAEVMADAAAARERLRRVPVAALVVSAEAGEAAAAEFVQGLRADPAFGSLPIVVVDAEGVALRVRLLESGADVCFPAGISHAELQGTLGALVRRTLRSEPRESRPTGGESTWLALQGDIQDFPLTWLLQVMKYDSRTAAIGIRTDTQEGAIYLRQGDAIHAQIRNGGKGEAALRQMLQWSKGRFNVQPAARPREQTITTSIMHLLLAEAVAEDHAAAGIFGAVSAEG